ncbi:MAG: energy transducer TonB [Rhodocyclales bacterium CG17_big_fil_post_rev_8_21_14_2_50_68_7]|nr:MAG: energy transducer TonB [Rhodocyclales bacterium CG17_big_fil_post_rev_8_21_14_2_50_68_7]
MPRLGSSGQLAGLAVVLAMHAAVLWGLWQHRLIPDPQEAMTLFVNFIAPPVPEKAPRAVREKVPPPPRPKPMEKTPRQLVVETPVVAPADSVAPSLPPRPEPAPEIEAPASPPAPTEPAPAPAPGRPIALGGELAAACPERSAPRYPAISRRRGEEGTVVLRVELDETGAVVAGEVATGSGFARLDEAALEAVRTWRCTPARRGAQPVRAVALQPFKFVLQGN